MNICLRTTGYKDISSKGIPNCYEIKLLYNIYGARMKIVFMLCFLILSMPSFSHIVYKGKGSGSFVQNDMTGLTPGDTLAIRAGRYERGGSFSNLTGITITNDQGVVEFGNTVTLGNLKMVSFSGNGWKKEFYGFRFQNMSGDAFALQAPCQSMVISYCEYLHLRGIAFNASQFFTRYNGNPSGFALYKTAFYYQKLLHSGPFFIGSWAANAEFQNVVDSIAFLHFIIDSTASDGNQVLGHSIYRMLASHWKVTGPCPNGNHDVGIFQISGNGTVCNVYRKGGWGYLWRIWNLGLNGRAESYLYNCIDLSSDNYGTIDTRIDPSDTTTGNKIPFCRGGSMHILNNTTGNKRTLNYVSQLVIAGNFCSSNGYRLEVRNNLCFNNIAVGTDPIIKQNTGDPIQDTSNNLYSANPIRAGILRDTILCYLNPGGRAIGQAIPYSFITSDIDGFPRPRGKSSDIGARESGDSRSGSRLKTAP
jgi:hypothetical protein